MVVSAEEFRAEIRAEVSRREEELLRDRAHWFERRPYSRGGNRLSAEAARQVKFVNAELEKLTGVPAWLSKHQEAALRLAGEDPEGGVYVARVRSGDRGLSYRPLSGGAPTATLYSLAQRGLLVLSYDGRGRIDAGQLTERGAEIVGFLRARAARAEERRAARRGRSGS